MYPNSGRDSGAWLPKTILLTLFVAISPFCFGGEIDNKAESDQPRLTEIQIPSATFSLPREWREVDLFVPRGSIPLSWDFPVSREMSRPYGLTNLGYRPVATGLWSYMHDNLPIVVHLLAVPLASSNKVDFPELLVETFAALQPRIESDKGWYGDFGLGDDDLTGGWLASVMTIRSEKLAFETPAGIEFRGLAYHESPRNQMLGNIRALLVGATADELYILMANAETEGRPRFENVLQTIFSTWTLKSPAQKTPEKPVAPVLRSPSRGFEIDLSTTTWLGTATDTYMEAVFGTFSMTLVLLDLPDFGESLKDFAFPIMVSGYGNIEKRSYGDIEVYSDSNLHYPSAFPSQASRAHAFRHEDTVVMIMLRGTESTMLDDLTEEVFNSIQLTTPDEDHEKIPCPLTNDLHVEILQNGIRAAEASGNHHGAQLARRMLFGSGAEIDFDLSFLMNLVEDDDSIDELDRIMAAGGPVTISNAQDLSRFSALLWKHDGSAEALTWLDRFAEDESLSTAAKGAKAYIHRFTGRPEIALEYYDELESQTGSVIWSIASIHILDEQGAHAEAGEKFEALVLEVPIAFTYAAYIRYLIYRGNLDRALEMANKGKNIERFGYGNGGLEYYVALAFALAGRGDEILPHLQSANQGFHSRDHREFAIKSRKLESWISDNSTRLEPDDIFDWLPNFLLEPPGFPWIMRRND